MQTQLLALLSLVQVRCMLVLVSHWKIDPQKIWSWGPIFCGKLVHGPNVSWKTEKFVSPPNSPWNSDLRTNMAWNTLLQLDINWEGSCATKHDFKWRHFGRVMPRGVVCKDTDVQVWTPSALVWANKLDQHVLDGLIEALIQTIGLGKEHKLA